MADHGVFRVERLRFESAKITRDVFVLGVPDWCNVLAETARGELVLVWQYRFGSDAFSLEVPGGVVEPSELPEHAAKRELLEETGYQAGLLELASVVEPNPPLHGNRCFTYLARNAHPTGATAFDDLEDLETVLVPKLEIASLIDEGVVTHALTVVALERYLRKYAFTESPPHPAG